MTCPKLFICKFVDSKYKIFYDAEDTWKYYNSCLNDTQDGCTLSKLTEEEFKKLDDLELK